MSGLPPINQKPGQASPPPVHRSSLPPVVAPSTLASVNTNIMTSSSPPIIVQPHPRQAPPVFSRNSSSASLFANPPSSTTGSISPSLSTSPSSPSPSSFSPSYHHHQQQHPHPHHGMPSSSSSSSLGPLPMLAKSPSSSSPAAAAAAPRSLPPVQSSTTTTTAGASSSSSSSPATSSPALMATSSATTTSTTPATTTTTPNTNTFASSPSFFAHVQKHAHQLTSNISAAAQSASSSIPGLNRTSSSSSSSSTASMFAAAVNAANNIPLSNANPEPRDAPILDPVQMAFLEEHMNNNNSNNGSNIMNQQQLQNNNRQHHSAGDLFARMNSNYMPSSSSSSSPSGGPTSLPLPVVDFNTQDLENWIQLLKRASIQHAGALLTKQAWEGEAQGWHNAVWTFPTEVREAAAYCGDDNLVRNTFHIRIANINTPLLNQLSSKLHQLSLFHSRPVFLSLYEQTYAEISLSKYLYSVRDRVSRDPSTLRMIIEKLFDLIASSSSSSSSSSNNNNNNNNNNRSSPLSVHSLAVLQTLIKFFSILYLERISSSSSSLSSSTPSLISFGSSSSSIPPPPSSSPALSPSEFNIFLIENILRSNGFEWASSLLQLSLPSIVADNILGKIVNLISTVPSSSSSPVISEDGLLSLIMQVPWSEISTKSSAGEVKEHILSSILPLLAYAANTKPAPYLKVLGALGRILAFIGTTFPDLVMSCVAIMGRSPWPSVLIASIVFSALPFSHLNAQELGIIFRVFSHLHSTSFEQAAQMNEMQKAQSRMAFLQFLFTSQPLLNQLYAQDTVLSKLVFSVRFPFFAIVRRVAFFFCKKHDPHVSFLPNQEQQSPPPSFSVDLGAMAIDEFFYFGFVAPPPPVSAVPAGIDGNSIFSAVQNEARVQLSLLMQAYPRLISRFVGLAVQLAHMPGPGPHNDLQRLFTPFLSSTPAPLSNFVMNGAILDSLCFMLTGKSISSVAPVILSSSSSPSSSSSSPQQQLLGMNEVKALMHLFLYTPSRPPRMLGSGATLACNLLATTKWSYVSPALRHCAVLAVVSAVQACSQDVQPSQDAASLFWMLLGPLTRQPFEPTFFNEIVSLHSQIEGQGLEPLMVAQVLMALSHLDEAKEKQDTGFDPYGYDWLLSWGLFDKLNMIFSRPLPTPRTETLIQILYRVMWSLRVEAASIINHITHLLSLILYPRVQQSSSSQQLTTSPDTIAYISKVMGYSMSSSNRGDNIAMLKTWVLTICPKITSGDAAFCQLAEALLHGIYVADQNATSATSLDLVETALSVMKRLPELPMDAKQIIKMGPRFPFIAYFCLKLHQPRTVEVAKSKISFGQSPTVASNSALGILLAVATDLKADPRAIPLWHQFWETYFNHNPAGGDVIPEKHASVIIAHFQQMRKSILAWPNAGPLAQMYASFATFNRGQIELSRNSIYNNQIWECVVRLCAPSVRIGAAEVPPMFLSVPINTSTVASQQQQQYQNSYNYVLGLNADPTPAKAPSILTPPVPTATAANNVAPITQPGQAGQLPTSSSSSSSSSSSTPAIINIRPLPLPDTLLSQEEKQHNTFLSSINGTISALTAAASSDSSATSSLQAVTDLSGLLTRYGSLVAALQKHDSDFLNLTQRMWMNQPAAFRLSVQCQEGTSCSRPAIVTCDSVNIVPGTPTVREDLASNRSNFHRDNMALFDVARSIAYLVALLNEVTTVLLAQPQQLSKPACHLVYLLLPIALGRSLPPYSPVSSTFINIVKQLGEKFIRGAPDQQAKILNVLLTQCAPYLTTGNDQVAALVGAAAAAASNNNNNNQSSSPSAPASAPSARAFMDTRLVLFQRLYNPSCLLPSSAPTKNLIDDTDTVPSSNFSSTTIAPSSSPSSSSYIDQLTLFLYHFSTLLPGDALHSPEEERALVASFDLKTNFHKLVSSSNGDSTLLGTFINFIPLSLSRESFQQLADTIVIGMLDLSFPLNLMPITEALQQAVKGQEARAKIDTIVDHLVRKIEDIDSQHAVYMLHSIVRNAPLPPPHARAGFMLGRAIILSPHILVGLQEEMNPTDPNQPKPVESICNLVIEFLSRTCSASHVTSSGSGAAMHLAEFDLVLCLICEIVNTCPPVIDKIWEIYTKIILPYGVQCSTHDVWDMVDNRFNSALRSDHWFLTSFHTKYNNVTQICNYVSGRDEVIARSRHPQRAIGTLVHTILMRLDWSKAALAANQSSDVQPSFSVALLHLYSMLSILLQDRMLPYVHDIFVSNASRPGYVAGGSGPAFLEWQPPSFKGMDLVFDGRCIMGFLESGIPPANPTKEITKLVYLLRDLAVASRDPCAARACAQETRSIIMAGVESASTGSYWYLPLKIQMDIVSSILIPLARHFSDDEDVARCILSLVAGEWTLPRKSRVPLAFANEKTFPAGNQNDHPDVVEFNRRVQGVVRHMCSSLSPPQSLSFLRVASSSIHSGPALAAVLEDVLRCYYNHSAIETNIANSNNNDDNDNNGGGEDRGRPERGRACAALNLSRVSWPDLAESCIASHKALALFGIADKSMHDLKNADTHEWIDVACQVITHLVRFVPAPPLEFDVLAIWLLCLEIVADPRWIVYSSPTLMHDSNGVLKLLQRYLGLYSGSFSATAIQALTLTPNRNIVGVPSSAPPPNIQLAARACLIFLSKILISKVGNDAPAGGRSEAYAINQIDDDSGLMNDTSIELVDKASVGKQERELMTRLEKLLALGRLSSNSSSLDGSSSSSSNISQAVGGLVNNVTNTIGVGGSNPAAFASYGGFFREAETFLSPLCTLDAFKVVIARNLAPMAPYLENL